MKKDNKKRRRNTGWKEYMRFKKRRAEYIDLYKRKLGASPSLKKDADGLARLQKLEDKLSIENVLLFRKVAVCEMEEEERLQAELRAQRKKEKKEKSVLNRLFKKKKREEEDDEDSEEIDLEWNEDKRNELFAEFDITPGETAPWEGGRPMDILVKADFRIHTIGLKLCKDSVDILCCVSKEVACRVIQRKSYFQLWMAMGDFYIEDSSKQCQKWPRILYTEKEAITNKDKAVIFLPGDMMETTEVPFLQVAIEMPATDQDVDVNIRAVSLPLCIVGNIACLMDLAAFFVPELSKLNFYAFSANVSDIYSKYSTTKKMKLKVAKEVSTHKLLGLDVYLGAVHVLLPEDITKGVRETEMLVCRLGDISVISNPRRVGVDEKLTEDNIYNDMLVNVSRINVLMTNKEKHWARPEVQIAENLYLVNDFNFNATVGLSIAPSEPEFASTKVGAALDVVTMNLTRTKYLRLMHYANEFVSNTKSIIDNSDVDFSVLTAQAKEAASNALAIRKEDGSEKEESNQNKENEKQDQIEENEQLQVQSELDEEEIRLLQRNKTLEVQAVLKGVSVLIEEVSAANEHTAIIEASIRGLQVEVQQRTFDMNVDVALEAIDVKDCLQTASTKQDKYLVVSRMIEYSGNICESLNQDLFHVHVGIVQESSPDYWQVDSDVTVDVAFGSLSRKNKDEDFN